MSLPLFAFGSTLALAAVLNLGPASAPAAIPAGTDPFAVLAQQPPSVQPKVVPKLPPLPPVPTDPPQVAAPATPTGRTDVTTLPRSRAPEMLGDFFVGRVGAIPLTVTTVTNGTTTKVIVGPRGPITVTVPTQFRNVQNTFAHVPQASRSFKIADNESPETQDRIFVASNYFNNYSKVVNERSGTGVEDLWEARQTMGFETSLFDGVGSVGMRLPLHTIGGNTGTVTGFADPEGTAFGDLSLILKVVGYRNDETGDLIAGGLAVTAPSGANESNPFHGTVLQPWLGYRWMRGDWYVQGFSSVDVPTDSADTTLLFTDIGIGYFLYRAPASERFLTMVAPTLEVHVNNPLNHRSILNFTDPAGTPDTVDVTLGTTFELAQRARLAVGVVAPVSGPRPFDLEAMVFFNLRF